MSIHSLVQSLLALDSSQIFWFITRSSGIMAYLLLWLSTAYGLAVSSKIFDPFLNRNHTYDFHEFLSLLSIGFLAVHVTVLLFDHFTPFTLIQVLFPFISSYRPLWVGIGIIAAYSTVLVTVTFYLRKRIGMGAFRSIHLLSFLAFFGAAVHGLFAGTDSSLSSMVIVYEVSTLSVVFLTVYWLFVTVQGKRHSHKQAQQSHLGKTSV